MRLRTFLVCIVVTVALAAAAMAKGPFDGRLCGVSGCVTLRGYEATAPFTAWWSRPFTERSAPAPAPFYRVVLRQETPDGLKPVTWTLLYVPRRAAMRIAQNRVPPYAAGVGPYWREVPGSARAALDRATQGVTPFPASPVWHACAVTVARPPYPDPAQPSFNYGNATIRVALSPPDGLIVAGRLPGGGVRASINPDGSIDAKFGWWRAGSGPIRISGRRVDRSAPPLRAHVPRGYGAGFQATGLTFPTTGCWRITGRYAGASLTFTVLVRKSRLGA